MAIANNNVQNVKFLRNGQVFSTHNDAYNALTGFTLSDEQDGTAILARYTAEDTNVKTLVGWVYKNGNAEYITIQDVEGASGDVEALRTEINNKLGTGVTSANTATAQFAALSGNNQSTSADTSVEGAKRYTDAKIGNIDYSGVTTGDGVYITNVIQSDGFISASTATLPTVDDTAEAKKFVIAVDETLGQISVSHGTISSSAETIVLTDNADGGVNFEVNIDNDTIVQDTTSKKLKVASAALTQYVGDEKTIHISDADAQNNKTVSTLLKIVRNASPSNTEVKEEYFLADADGTAITGADTIKIYKDSHIVSITYITDSGDTEHYQNLEYKYIDASGETKTEYVDISSLVLEAEFASGLTIENHVARGVVDSTSEKDSQGTPVDFLTVGADGFKISGIKDEIDRKINALDATVTDATSGNHVTITIEEVDGKLVQSGLTIEENDIASASDLAELSGKTITVLTSANESIAIGNGTAQADGTIGIDLITDASKIKMSGFTADASGFTAITEATSVTDAVKAIETEMIANENITAAALTDLNGRLDTVEDEYISGATVNGVELTPTNKVLPISIQASTTATTASTANAIVVDTNSTTGAITLGLNYIDCGTY